MSAKVVLSAPDGQLVYPHLASLGLYITEYGVEITAMVRFCVDHVGPWHMTMPSNFNSQVQRIAFLGVSVVGETMVQRACGYDDLRTLYLTVDGIYANMAKAMVTAIVVLVQPMSFRFLFLEWLCLGTAEAPCTVTLDFNVSALPQSLTDNLDVYLTGEASKKAVRSLSLENPTTLHLAQNDNVKLCFNVRRNARGFGVTQALAAQNDEGMFVIISPRPLMKPSRPWFLKARRDTSSNVMHICLSDTPLNACVVFNKRMLLTVADLVFDKVHQAMKCPLAICVDSSTPQNVLTDVANQIVRLPVYASEWELHDLHTHASWSSWRTTYELPKIVRDCLTVLPL